jgi:hypothetical protein
MTALRTVRVTRYVTPLREGGSLPCGTRGPGRETAQYSRFA